MARLRTTSVYLMPYGISLEVFRDTHVSQTNKQTHSRFTFTIHWIPSHVERTSFGIKPIPGNIEADLLAKETRSQAAL